MKDTFYKFTFLILFSGWEGYLFWILWFSEGLEEKRVGIDFEFYDFKYAQKTVKGPSIILLSNCFLVEWTKMYFEVYVSKCKGRKKKVFSHIQVCFFSGRYWHLSLIANRASRIIFLNLETFPKSNKLISGFSENRTILACSF